MLCDVPDKLIGLLPILAGSQQFDRPNTVNSELRDANLGRCQGMLVRLDSNGDTVAFSPPFFLIFFWACPAGTDYSNAHVPQMLRIRRFPDKEQLS